MMTCFIGMLLWKKPQRTSTSIKFPMIFSRLSSTRGMTWTAVSKTCSWEATKMDRIRSTHPARASSAATSVRQSSRSRVISRLTFELTLVSRSSLKASKCPLVVTTFFLCCFIGERRFQCSQCHKAFATAGALRVHEKTHTGRILKIKVVL